MKAEVSVINEEGVIVLQATTTGGLPGAAEREYLKRLLTQHQVSLHASTHIFYAFQASSSQPLIHRPYATNE
ncbi:hypothetical protein C2E19_16850 [Pseudomonas sp. DTU12.3]|uniref:hypothetical protein n=1 Tax=Pseudomonas sp. DTU12.3 TaxID=2073078 RepID=UPI001013AC4F|nr:hypothetical protein [Pseudomonas sp. DTU12.3]QAX85421.1 hypothetical protein C2E19_16850 [Pseudomonas sp. DTU12.3]